MSFEFVVRLRRQSGPILSIVREWAYAVGTQVHPQKSPYSDGFGFHFGPDEMPVDEDDGVCVRGFQLMIESEPYQNPEYVRRRLYQKADALLVALPTKSTGELPAAIKEAHDALRAFAMASNLVGYK